MNDFSSECSHCEDPTKASPNSEKLHEEVPFFGALSQLLHIPADASHHENIETSETIKARCSHCEAVCIHSLVERNNVRKDEYRCTSCTERTCKCLKFDACHGAAKSNFLWDDALCTECDRAVEQFASGDISIQTLVDELQLQGATNPQHEESNPVPEITEVGEEKAEQSNTGDAVIQWCLTGSESIEAFCPHCSTTSTHQLVERNRARKDEYYCTACLERTCKCLKYSICHGAAKSNFLWDDALCVECDRQFAESQNRARAELDKGAHSDQNNAMDVVLGHHDGMIGQQEGNLSRASSLERCMVAPDIGLLQQALQKEMWARVDRPLARVRRRRPDDVLEDWEVLRDALLSYPGPQRADVDKYRRMCTHKAWLRRWIIGSDKDPAYAMRRILVHLRWRQEYGLDAIMEEDWSAFDARREMCIAGVDRSGRPTWTWNCALHDAANATPEQATRYLVCMMERAWAVNPQANRINVLCNCRGLRYENYEHAMFLQTLAILSEQYPDNLERTYMFPATWIIHAILATGKVFMSEVTMAKLVPASEDDLQEILDLEFDKAQIEPQFGGTLDAERAKARRLLEEDAEMRRAWEEEEAYAGEDVRPTRAVRALQMKMMGAEERERLLATGYDSDSHHFGDVDEDADASTLGDATDAGSEAALAAAMVRSGSFSTVVVSEEEWHLDGEEEEEGEGEEEKRGDALTVSVRELAVEERGGGLGPRRDGGELTEKSARLLGAVGRGVQVAARLGGEAGALALAVMMQVVWALALIALTALKRVLVNDK